MSHSRANSLVMLPLTFRAIGSVDLRAPLQELSRTVNVLQPDEILVRVSYASLNAMDAKIWMADTNFFQQPIPLVVGYDYCGTVVAVGAEHPVNGEAEAITLGSSVRGSTFDIGWGGGCLGEYVVGKRNRATLRGEVPEAEAATFGIAFTSAYEGLFLTADISKRRGQTIFIPGGGGGVGHFAVQLAKAYGLRVITSASKADGLQLLHKLGADVVLDYSKQDVVVDVMEATNGHGADIVYDCTYQPRSMKQSACVVAKHGQWVRLGPWLADNATQTFVENVVTDRGGKVLISDLGRYRRDPEYVKLEHRLSDGERLSRQLYMEYLVRPHITAVVPFEAAAVQKVLTDSLKGVVGKQVVKVQ